MSFISSIPLIFMPSHHSHFLNIWNTIIKQKCSCLLFWLSVLFLGQYWLIVLDFFLLILGYIFLFIPYLAIFDWMVDIVNFTLLDLDICVSWKYSKLRLWQVKLLGNILGLAWKLLVEIRAAFSVGLILLYYWCKLYPMSHELWDFSLWMVGMSSG